MKPVSLDSDSEIISRAFGTPRKTLAHMDRWLDVYCPHCRGLLGNIHQSIWRDPDGLIQANKRLSRFVIKQRDACRVKRHELQRK